MVIGNLLCNSFRLVLHTYCTKCIKWSGQLYIWYGFRFLGMAEINHYNLYRTEMTKNLFHFCKAFAYMSPQS